MIVKIIDIHNNHINIAGIEAVREDKDGMINFIPRQETVMLHFNGNEIMRSERPSFDCRMIKSLELIV